jgi:hypothetical protein
VGEANAEVCSATSVAGVSLPGKNGAEVFNLRKAYRFLILRVEFQIIEVVRIL